MTVTRVDRQTILVLSCILLVVLGAGFLFGWIVGEHATVERYLETTKVCRDLRS
jgi:hypothetical protein